MILFFLSRLYLYFYLHKDCYELSSSISLRSLLIGIQFDSIVLSYILLIPFLILFLADFYELKYKLIAVVISLYLSVISALLVLIILVDMPYFIFFHNRLSEASLQWMHSWKIVLQMVLDSQVYCALLIAAIVLIPLAAFVMYKNSIHFFIKNIGNSRPGNKNTILWFLLLGAICFLGMRGKIVRPVRIGDSSYCHNAVLNILGLNPVFSFVKSYSDKVRLMNDEEAIMLTQKFLHIQNPHTNISPIAYSIRNDTEGYKYNIVLVLMESMSANYLGYFGNKERLTPNLDTLLQKSLFFTNAYSAGIHTNNGIFSTLYSFPALKRTRPMYSMPARKYSGLPYVTKQHGYQNLFFCAHSFEFDNIVNFMPENNFDRIISSEHFPPDASISAFGVPDSYLFSSALTVLDTINNDKPFFATLLTASNHEPYILPKDFICTQTEKNLRAVSFADKSIGDFLQAASKHDWYDSTIFIFVADHGFRVGQNAYDLELSFQHIPIIFYAPQFIQPRIMNNYIGQIDVFPTLMGLMHLNYINNTLGRDVINTPRECIYFSADDKLGCVDDRWLYVYRFSGGESLYEYKTGNTHDFARENISDMNRMRQYAFSQIQTAEWMYGNDKTEITEEQEKLQKNLH